MHPPALLSKPIRNRAHRVLLTRNHHRCGRIDRRDPHTLTQQAATPRPQPAATATIAPPAGSACINRPRAATNIAASASDNTPATCAAAISPTE